MVLAGLALASALADNAAAFEYRVHRRRPGELVLASTPEKGLPTPWLKCFYDVRSNSLLRAQPFGPFMVDEVREKAGSFEFVPAAEERSIRTPSLSANCSSLRVRQSTYAEFAEARPERVKNGYGPVGTELHESAGPCQLVDKRLWFGKTFYDGEGSTGIGGFGYLDTATRQYVMFSPPAIRPYSVTALLVEPDTVWLGATWWGEYGPGPSRLRPFVIEPRLIGGYEIREALPQ